MELVCAKPHGNHNLAYVPVFHETERFGKLTNLPRLLNVVSNHPQKIERKRQKDFSLSRIISSNNGNKDLRARNQALRYLPFVPHFLGLNIMSDSSSSESSSTMEKKQSVTKLGKFDVLMGRGAFATDYEGNLRLRETVLERYHDYAKTSRRSDKHSIAKEIVQTVLKRGGRFLQSSSSSSRKSGDNDNAVNLPSESNPWYVVTDQSILCTKVKQLLRDAGKDTREKTKRMRGTTQGGIPSEIQSTVDSPVAAKRHPNNEATDDEDSAKHEAKRVKTEPPTSSRHGDKLEVCNARVEHASYPDFCARCAKLSCISC